MSSSKLQLPSGRAYASSFQLQYQVGVCKPGISSMFWQLTVNSSNACRISIAGFDGELEDSDES